MRENEEPVTENLLVIHGLGWVGLLSETDTCVKDSVVLASLAKCLMTDVSCLTLKNVPMRTNEITRTTNLYLSVVCFLKSTIRNGDNPPRSATKHARVLVSQKVVYMIADNTKKIHVIYKFFKLDISFCCEELLKNSTMANGKVITR